MNLFGLANRPTLGSDTTYEVSVVQDVLTELNAKGLNIYRMCFGSELGSAGAPVRDACIQYYLDHCPHDLIICYWHTPYGTLMGDAEWSRSTTMALDIMSKFKAYENRVWLEPANERTNDASTYTRQINTFIQSIRNAGYTCPITVNRWYTQPWSTLKNIVDPLGKFIHGEHYYTDSTTVAYQEQKIQAGLDLGLKMLITEVGADLNEFPQFDQTKVDNTSLFLKWCYDKGVGACVWTQYGVYMRSAPVTNPSSCNWKRYGELNLQFPISPAPGPLNILPISAFELGVPSYSPTVLDPVVTYNGSPSLRNDPASPYLPREVNGKWTAVKPGDHILFKAWMKAEPSPLRTLYGVRIGIDWYGANANLGGTSYNPLGTVPNEVQTTLETNLNFVPWGSDWTFREIDLLVPELRKGLPVYGMIAWFQAGFPAGETGKSWIADSELYINEDVAPTPIEIPEWLVTATPDPVLEQWNITVKPQRLGGWA